MGYGALHALARPFFTVTHRDGRPLKAKQEQDSLLIGPDERYDLVVAADKPVAAREVSGGVGRPKSCASSRTLPGKPHTSGWPPPRIRFDADGGQSPARLDLTSSPY